MGEFELAIQDLDEALRLDPRDAEVFANRGAAYVGLGQVERAIEDFNNVVSIDPRNEGA